MRAIMKTAAMVLSALLALGTVACEKKSDDAKGKSTSKGKGPGTTKKGASPAAGNMDALRPPLASDLEPYLKGIPGTGDKLYATIQTTLGEFHCELYHKRAPMTVANFVGLARGLKPYRSVRTGKIEKGPYFEGIIFHRVIPNFMLQTGDPTGTGRGGPGYRFRDEFHPELRHDKPGIMSMANAGVATNGSQFFITERPTPHLDDKHTVFGLCAEIDLIKQIANVPKRGSRPVDDVSILKVTFQRK